MRDGKEYPRRSGRSTSGLPKGCLLPIVTAEDIFICPTKGKNRQRQDKDRYECHNWALNNTGFDPRRLQNIPSNTVSDNRYEPSQPHVLKGAARGAAPGAVDGAITDNAGKGAGAEAAMGGLAGGFRRLDERMQPQDQQQQSAQASQQNQRTSCQRVMAASLEGRGYSVK
jgi:Glycine-zipper domain